MFRPQGCPSLTFVGYILCCRTWNFVLEIRRANRVYNVGMNTRSATLDTSALERPSPRLLTYYVLTGLLSGPACVIVIPALIIRYNTLRYQFEETGLRMQLGLFFKREVIVAFRRIQDIHVSRNLIQRWLGIASVSVQTASGNAMPEIILEGITDPDSVRDWLYERMRGAKRVATTAAVNAVIATSKDALAPPRMSAASESEVTELLRGIRDNLAHLVEKTSGQSDTRS